jgi:hypothetical protein
MDVLPSMLVFDVSLERGRIGETLTTSLERTRNSVIVFVAGGGDKVAIDVNGTQGGVVVAFVMTQGGRIFEGDFTDVAVRHFGVRRGRV